MILMLRKMRINKTTMCRYFEYGGQCIPKVSEAYTENRINEILDAALEVSARKPLHKVTMKDIVRQTGLSQGAYISILPILKRCGLRCPTVLILR